MTMHLIDDGTLDTVFECSECGQQERYSQEWRDEWLLHDDDCPAVEAGEYPEEQDAECTCSPDLDVSGAEVAAADDHECSADEPPTEPQEGDYILAPAGQLGGRTAVSIHGDRYLWTFSQGQAIASGFDSAEDAALQAIRQRMENESYYPNVWRQDDHGGFTLLDVTT